MKNLKRFYILMVAILIVNLLSPIGLLSAKAADNVTKVTIHKVEGTEVKEGTYDALAGETPEGVGAPISNIGFTYFKVDEDTYKTLKEAPESYDTVEKVKALVGSEGVQTGLTNGQGVVDVVNLEEGFYWFVENGSTAVAASHAVPFGLALPMTKEDGSGYMEHIHVWPKNELENTPEIDKTVSDLENKSASYDVGQEVEWFIQTDVPKGIEEYKQYVITDKLDSKLDFVQDKVTVTYNNVALTEGTHYNVTYDESDHEVKVVLTETGLKFLGDSLVPEQKLITKIVTTINESAVPGLEIKNGGKLEFDNGHGKVTTPGGDTPPPEVPEEEKPFVYTGGKKFVKIANNDSSVTLEGAEFVIKNLEGNFLKQSDGKVEWVTDQSDATKFISDAQGKFEVKGLAYGVKGDDNTGSTDYILVETKAPEGYALPTNPETTFTINKVSYYQDPQAVDLKDATAQEINNQKVTIPNTGGIGTIIFTVVGLLFILGAFTMLKRRKEA